MKFKYLLFILLILTFLSGCTSGRSIQESNIEVNNYTSQTIEDLELLGKVWGFLKYYHPAVTEGKYKDWDAELFHIMPAILNSADKNARNKLLSKWIESLGKISIAENADISESSSVKMLPDLAWTEEFSLLGEKLVKQLSDIKKANRKEGSYYVSSASGIGNPIFNNEKSYSGMKFDNDGLRLLALYRYWNMIQYFFPYKYLIDRDWNTVLREYIPKMLEANGEEEYKLTLVDLICQISDTHANIYNDSTLYRLAGVNAAPYKVRFVEGKAVITEILTEKESLLQRGDIIESINGETIELIVEERLPHTPASNYDVKLRNIAHNLLRTNNEQIDIQVMRGGEIATYQISCVPFSTLASPNKESHKLLSPKIGYIYPGTIKAGTIPTIMNMFKETNGIIVDLRCYPSEFIVFSLGEYFMPEPTDFVKFTLGSINYPGLFTYTPFILSVGKKNPNYYKGKIVILVNDETQSQAEYTTMAFSVAPKATVIGSTTAAADGNISNIVLPGNIQTIITGIGIYYPNGSETQRVGIKLDEEVKPTIKGIFDGRDELLERAIELINSNKN